MQRISMVYAASGGIRDKKITFKVIQRNGILLRHRFAIVHSQENDPAIAKLCPVSGRVSSGRIGPAPA
jgi:hypothetical protein